MRGRVAVSAGVPEMSEQYMELLRGVDPALLSGPDCALAAERLAVVEKACAGLRLRLAARAAECGAHRGRGHADPVDWLAQLAGTTRGEAKAALETAAVVAEVPAVGKAVAEGMLSTAQAQEIVRTEAECPGTAAELVALASHQGLAALREEGRRLRLAAADPEELHRRQTAAREFRHWRDGMGMVCFRGALPPETGVPLVNRLDAECDRVRRAARREGSTDAREAHAADAFVRLVEGNGRGRSRAADLVVVCDIDALHPRSWTAGTAAVEGAPGENVGAPSTAAVPRPLVGVRRVGRPPTFFPGGRPTRRAHGRRRGFPAVDRVGVRAPTGAAVATAWSGTMCTRWPTPGLPPTTTSGPCVGRATPRRPSGTGGPGCSAPGPGHRPGRRERRPGPNAGRRQAPPPEAGPAVVFDRSDD